MRQKIIGGKCGCIWCRTGSAPSSRGGWKSLKPMHSGSYGRKSGRQGKGQSR